MDFPAPSDEGNVRPETVYMLATTLSFEKVTAVVPVFVIETEIVLLLATLTSPKLADEGLKANVPDDASARQGKDTAAKAKRARPSNVWIEFRQKQSNCQVDRLGVSQLISSDGRSCSTVE